MSAIVTLMLTIGSTASAQRSFCDFCAKNCSESPAVLPFPVFKEGAWIVRNPSRGGVFWRREPRESSARRCRSPAKAPIRRRGRRCRPTRPKCRARSRPTSAARSPFERPKRVSLGERRTSSLTPLQDLDGIITPSDLHFERHHGGVPAIDPDAALAADSRHGRSADGLHARRSAPLPRQVDDSRDGMLGQRRTRLSPRRQSDRSHAAADRRPDEHQRMDRRAARHAAARSRRVAEGARGSSPKAWTPR